MRMRHLLGVGLGALLALALGTGIGLALSQNMAPVVQAEPLAPLPVAFTYQGRLEEDGGPVEGQYDFEFTLYDQLDGGTMLGSTHTITDVLVSDGLFSVLVEVDPSHLNGEQRFLQVGVRPTGGGAFSPLTPRQELTAAPYAVYALQASELSISGTVGMRLALPSGGGAPSVVGGSTGNLVNPSTAAAVIGGGEGNLAGGDWSTIGGGLANQAMSTGATVGGGGGNVVLSDTGTIGGGYMNVAAALGATIAGGENVTATGEYAAVGGGYHNRADGWSSTVGGGHANKAHDQAGTVSGGEGNWAQGGWSTVGGGGLNSAQTAFSTVPGGLGALTQGLGQWAYASGVFDQPGDAQASLYVLRGSTVGSLGSSELYLDGVGERIHLIGVRAMTFDILVVGRSDLESATWYMTGAHIVGTAAVGPGGVIGVDGSSRSFGMNSGVHLTSESDTLQLHVEQGITFDGRVQWVAVVRTAEVAW